MVSANVVQPPSSINSAIRALSVGLKLCVIFRLSIRGLKGSGPRHCVGMADKRLPTKFGKSQLSSLYLRVNRCSSDFEMCSEFGNFVKVRSHFSCLCGTSSLAGIHTINHETFYSLAGETRQISVSAFVVFKRSTADRMRSRSQRVVLY